MPARVLGMPVHSCGQGSTARQSLIYAEMLVGLRAAKFKQDALACHNLEDYYYALANSLGTVDTVDPETVRVC